MTLVAAGSSAQHFPALVREVFDVSGAGDTVIAAMALSLGAGCLLTEAASVANQAAGLAVAKAGTATVSFDELAESLAENGARTVGAKIATWEQVLEQVANWRAKGLRVGFTNGCFDLIHPGHVSLLTQARAACDRLIVGLNTDASMKRLKGPERPFQPETARAAVIAALRPVDLVVLFGQDTPADLIRAVRPDVLVKGADYRPDQVAGSDIVAGYGGQLLLVDLVPGHSTTETLTKAGKFGSAKN
jgi:D-beta-D-heptose 7-phosphate kinase/D-beta-D-heptose 1-phosphate adenosyltransferase